MSPTPQIWWESWQITRQTLSKNDPEPNWWIQAQWEYFGPNGMVEQLFDYTAIRFNWGVMACIQNKPREPQWNSSPPPTWPLTPFPLLHSTHKLPAWSTSRRGHLHLHMRWGVAVKKWGEKSLEKGRTENYIAWRIEQTATFHHQNSNMQLFRPWTMSICFKGWKASSKIKQVFDFSVMYKGSHTPGRIREWISSSSIHCLSYGLF